MPILTSALEKSSFDPETLAADLGVQPWEVSEWLRSDNVPDEHLLEVQHLLDVDIETERKAAEEKGASKKRRASSQKKRRTATRRPGVSADTSQAINLTASLAYDSMGTRSTLARIAQAEPANDEGTLAALVEATLGINKTTRDAIIVLDEVAELENPLKAVLRLGQLDRRVLSELHRVASAILNKDDDELPSGDDAPLVAVERVDELSGESEDTLKWLVEIVK